VNKAVKFWVSSDAGNFLPADRLSVFQVKLSPRRSCLISKGNHHKCFILVLVLFGPLVASNHRNSIEFNLLKPSGKFTYHQV
jgi:hypothetical protein